MILFNVDGSRRGVTCITREGGADAGGKFLTLHGIDGSRHIDGVTCVTTEGVAVGTCLT